MSVAFKFSVFLIFLTIFQRIVVVVCGHRDEDGPLYDYASGEDQNYTFLVTGGYRPEKHTLVKHIVSIRKRYHRDYFGDNHFCGGSIISPRVILTAAHCVKTRTLTRSYDIRVVAKTPNRLQETSATVILDVKKVIAHPEYDNKNFRNDVAILRLSKDINEDNVLAKRIPLADSAPKADTPCTVVGWGRVFFLGPMPADAMYVDLNIFDFKTCERREPGVLKPGMLCAGDDADIVKDACSGDSGGPLICDGKVAGIVSFGFRCAEGKPGYYTDVWYHRQWITENRSARGFRISFGITVLAILLQGAINSRCV